ncbi:Colicin I receptor precursor [Thiorhodovibrio litoralis]|nr:TonB-dependent receptor [Thiorhodovibrio winogradskyi]MBK5970394.1 TonB-dependent receptor [Thiorhodovibrio winogradskyi]WPL14303.1 Colicin I receptor precursor [Thiorhodovibrio litoralis]
MISSAQFSSLGAWTRQSVTATVLLTSLLSAAGFASERAGEVADTESLNDLLSIIDQQTQLATKSGMNADYVPGMATILTGDDLRARGVRSVSEALALVPGISQAIEMTGERQILSRGIGYGYASGNLKILLDGVSMNATLYATANPVLNIPIEQVERIEVIRGPGASVHGEYAFAGVIDVITRTGDREVSASAMEDGDYGGGLMWHWADPERDLALSVNAYGLDGDGGVDVATDAAFNLGMPEISNAPGLSNESHRYRGLFADIRWGAFFGSIKLLDDDYGDYFGINHFLPPDDDRLASRQRYQSLQLGTDLTFNARWRSRLRFEVLRYERDRDDLFVFPTGYFFDDESVVMSQDYQETRYLIAADTHWNPNDRHQVLFGLEASHVAVDEATWDWPAAFEIDFPWLDDQRNRRILSAIVQDEFRLNERLTLTGALRFDDYSDVGSHLSPRLAAVWRIDAENIIKAQYARAFRPPTFYEQEYSANDDIGFGEIATYELGYILKKPTWEGRVIVFHSELTDPIVFYNPESAYANVADARLQGVEFEYQQRLRRDLKLDGNLSYVQTRDESSGRSLPGGTNLLANLALIWRPAPAWTLAAQLAYVGETERREDDDRDPLEAYTTLDLTLSYAKPGSGPFARLGVKNLANANVRYPDQEASAGGVDWIYADDYPRPDRRWWLELGYAF